MLQICKKPKLFSLLLHLVVHLKNTEQKWISYYKTSKKIFREQKSNFFFLLLTYCYTLYLEQFNEKKKAFCWTKHSWYEMV